MENSCHLPGLLPLSLLLLLLLSQKDFYVFHFSQRAICRAEVENPAEREAGFKGWRPNSCSACDTQETTKQRLYGWCG